MTMNDLFFGWRQPKPVKPVLLCETCVWYRTEKDERDGDLCTRPNTPNDIESLRYVRASGLGHRRMSLCADQRSDASWCGPKGRYHLLNAWKWE